MAPRTPLSRERIVDAAAAVADRDGLGGVSMRTVGRALGVEAMSLYHHVASKDDLLDALADWAMARVDLPDLDTPWRAAMRERARSARAVFSAHPWALGLVESRRTPGSALLRHHDTVLGCLRRNGFSVPLAAHAFSVLDSYVYGFVLTEQNLPFEAGEAAEEFVDSMDLPVDAYPHLGEMMATLVVGGGYSYADEFDVGLELILDGLAARLATDPA